MLHATTENLIIIINCATNTVINIKTNNQYKIYECKIKKSVLSNSIILSKTI